MCRELERRSSRVSRSSSLSINQMYRFSYLISPLFFILISYIAGILLQNAYRYLDTQSLLLGCILAFMISLFSCRNYRKVTPILFFVFFTLIGMLNTSCHLSSFGFQQINHYTGKKGILWGTVYQEETASNSEYQEIRLDTHYFQDENRCSAANGKVLLRIYGENLSIQPGTRIRAEVLLTEPDLPGNFGEFNYRDYLARQNIFLTDSILSDQIDIVGYDEQITLSSFFQHIKYGINQRINQLYLPSSRGMIKAMITGDRKEVLPDWTDIFQDAGVMHILAISGLHVGILAIALFFLFRRSPAPGGMNTYQYLMIIFILLAYTAITGFRPSVSRATAMFTIILLAECFNRPYHVYNSLYLAALILLLWQPLYLFDTGFVLSFVITFFIIFISPILSEKLNFLPAAIGKPFSISLSAWLGMVPLSAYFFSKISFIAILSNLLVVPLIGIILILALISICLSCLFLPMAALVASVNEVFINFFVLLIRTFSLLPFAFQYVARPEIILILLYYSILILFFYTLCCWPEYSQREKKTRFWLIASLVFILLFIPLGDADDLLAVHFINVGEGDCILVQTPCRKNILIDGGGTPYYDFDVGHHTVIPYLRRKGINRIDLMILTHPDLDHLEGLISILKEMKVKLVMDSGVPYENETYLEFLTLIRLDDTIDYHQASAGDIIRISPDLEFLVLHPARNFAYCDDSYLNNHSIVLKLRYKKTSFLFTGDIEERAEASLLPWKELLECDILKVAHHGSNTSTGQLFIAEAKPEACIISVGSNQFGHPHREIVERLKDTCGKVFRTDRNGTILVESNGLNYKISTLWE